MPDSILHSLSIAVALTLLPLAAGAQSPTSTRPTADWDVAVVAGGLAGHGEVPDNARFADSWSRAGLAGVVIGWHWTAHVKAEFEVAASGEGHQFVERSVTVANDPYPVPYGSDQFTRVREAAATLMWQFFDNQWVHPFVQAGVAVDVERQRFYTWPNTFYTGDPRTAGTQVIVTGERREGLATRATVRGVVGGGAKLYVSPRVFVRSDARLAIGSRIEHIAFRAGIGCDF